jgi:hypothetical protein
VFDAEEAGLLKAATQGRSSLVIVSCDFDVASLSPPGSRERGGQGKGTGDLVVTPTRHEMTHKVGKGQW